jgi:hypothetical protein
MMSWKNFQNPKLRRVRLGTTMPKMDNVAKPKAEFAATYSVWASASAPISTWVGMPPRRTPLT